MGRLMSQHEGQFIGVAGIRDQCEREANHRSAPVVQGLEGIGRLARAIIDDDAEIAIPGRAALATDRFGHRLHLGHHTEEGFRRRPRRLGRGGRDLRRGRRYRRRRHAAAKGQDHGEKKG